MWYSVCSRVGVGLLAGRIYCTYTLLDYLAFSDCVLSCVSPSACSPPRPVRPPPFLYQFGHIVLTTTFGIMDHEEARRKHTGGKILGFFY